MNYKTSLLIYRTQSINVNDIWSAKSRLVKSLTPLFRILKEDDFRRIDDFNAHYEGLVNAISAQLAPLEQARKGENDPIAKEQINEQISLIKLTYLEQRIKLDKQFKNEKILDLESKTKLLALIYCTWSEAIFKKIKHTPHGFSISQRVSDFGGKVHLQWPNLIDEVLSRIPDLGNEGDKIQMATELKTIADSYIIEQSKLRNKIAHGQWSEAMNTDNLDLVIGTSLKISDLDFVEIDFSFDVHFYFTQILESILESNQPDEMILKRHDSYLFLKTKLDRFINERKSWDVKSRSAFLQQRSIDNRNFGIAQKLRSHNIDSKVIKEITGIEF